MKDVKRIVGLMRCMLSALVVLLLHCPLAYSAEQEELGTPRLVDVHRIWDKAPHNAFTDLIRFKGRWYCTFREARNHWGKGASGKVRVITSTGGKEWESAALFSMEGDLRDPKLSIHPDNKLMVIYFRRFNPHRYPQMHELQFMQLSSDGHQWEEPVQIGFPNRWLWRVTWHEGKAYGVSHGATEGRPPFTHPRAGRFLISTDGKTFTPHADAEYGGEATIRFTPDGTAVCLRRSKGNRGLIGTSVAPYTQWEWKDLGVRIGGPNMIQLPSGRFVAVVRLYDGKTRTSLCHLDAEEAELTETLTLPSGGDTSYAGLVWHDGMLWISYYSSHEGKASIYLARVKFE